MNDAPRRRRMLVAVVSAMGLAGCAGKTGPMPNFLTGADRVPPPATRAPAPGSAVPYYPNDPIPSLTVNPPITGSPVVGAPSWPASTPPITAPPAVGSANPFAANPYTPGAYPPVTAGSYPAAPAAPTTSPYGASAYGTNPFGASPAPTTSYPPTNYPPTNGVSPQGAAFGTPAVPQPRPLNSPYSAIQGPPSPTASAGDVIAAPRDSGPLRFEPQGPWAKGGVATQPPPPPSTQFARAAPASQLPATAKGWISGSAPVRPQIASSDPGRVRLPSGGAEYREPVSVAALGAGSTTGRVQITPLDGPAGSPPSDGRSPDTLGWR